MASSVTQQADRGTQPATVAQHVLLYIHLQLERRGGEKEDTARQSQIMSVHMPRGIRLHRRRASLWIKGTTVIFSGLYMSCIYMYMYLSNMMFP